MKIFVLRGFKSFFFAHKKIKIFRVGGKNRVGRVTPIKHLFFLGLRTKNCDPLVLEYNGCNVNQW